MASAIYLDNAATSYPKPQSVLRSVSNLLTVPTGNPGRGAHRPAQRGSKVVEETRYLVQQLVNARSPKDVVFTANCTDALNMGIRGVVQPGMHLITTDMEHNSVLRPIQALVDQGVATVTYLTPDADGRIQLQQVQQAWRPNTELVVMTHASNTIGTVQPIADVGAYVRMQGALLMVDAAQTGGCVNIDMESMSIDLLALAGHKSLLGLTGVGALVIGDRAKGIQADREGGSGGDSRSPRQPLELPFRLEAGTLNVHGIAALGAGVRYVHQATIDAIRQHEHDRLEELVDGLQSLSGYRVVGEFDRNRHANVIAFVADFLPPEELVTILDAEFKIAVRAGLHCAPRNLNWLPGPNQGTVRVSPGPFTQSGEIQRVLQALTEIESYFAVKGASDGSY